MLFDALSPWFPPEVRTRAAGYADRIEIVTHSERQVHAHIRGTELYCTRVLRKDARISVDCTCAAFDRDPCKHLWALLTHIERTRLMSASPRVLYLDRQVDPSSCELTGQPGGATRVPSARPANPRAASPRAAPWRQALEQLSPSARSLPDPVAADAELIYVLDVEQARVSPGVSIEVALRKRKRDGGWSKPWPLRVPIGRVARYDDPADAELVPLLCSLTPGDGRDGHQVDGHYQPTLTPRASIMHGTAAPLVEKIARTGRLHLRMEHQRELPELPVRWDGGAPYGVRFFIEPIGSSGAFLFSGRFERGKETRPLAERLLLLPDGVVFFPGIAARLTLDAGVLQLVTMLLSRGGALSVPREDADAFALALRGVASLPSIEIPEALRIEERHVAPRARLRLSSPPRFERATQLRGALSFMYDVVEIAETDARPQLPVPGARALIGRDFAAEEVLVARLVSLGLRRQASYGRDLDWALHSRTLDETLVALLGEGWQVEMDDHAFRTHEEITVEVRSGVDWFDLHAEVHYGKLRVSLPELLSAQRRGSRMVTLSDGSMGLLPSEWLSRHRLLGQVGQIEGEALRFGKKQLGLLDALLAALPGVRVDQKLRRAREALARWEGLVPLEAPHDFVGELRAYQKEGLGWLAFLRDFEFGGCLADDMGLGKTIQVLALLSSRRAPKGGKAPRRPSLVVAPKSLLFNWRAEAARFTPTLRVHEHHGTTRKRDLSVLTEHDVVVTTYQTLVRDIESLRKIEFDYVILDEAQAVKNPRTEAAKAARLLHAQHRLALTGTPIENRLSDLWSLFEFLNPGMLGAFTAFKTLGKGEVINEEARAVLARALRPFLLRRTKSEVARDLPARTEQLLYCELEGDERRRYDELRAHYRSTLLGLIDEQGVARSQMHVLEALLRLRQAACHPGLVDPAHRSEKSAKVTLLLSQLEEVVAEGHKAVVFSQFTTLLGLVRERLDEAKIGHDTLDGRTRDREAKVARFQADPECKVFLVSLKAGGTGLNLTAAEYVFLLDPWWNPAVEAQAIDRTHRIGQTRPVFAYRLIGRDTVEEKVLALQDQKRELANAILGADQSVLGKLGRKELEALLS